MKRGPPTNTSKPGNATNISNGVDVDSWWVGRVYAMRWRNGNDLGY